MPLSVTPVAAMDGVPCTVSAISQGHPGQAAVGPGLPRALALSPGLVGRHPPTRLASSRGQAKARGCSPQTREVYLSSRSCVLGARLVPPLKPGTCLGPLEAIWSF